jgi:hypothetical protein
MRSRRASHKWKELLQYHAEDVAFARDKREELLQENFFSFHFHPHECKNCKLTPHPPPNCRSRSRIGA